MKKSKKSDAMDDLQIQARALGDPTRHKLFRYIANSSYPVDVEELTKYLGLHHNAIRQHLTKLLDAGLIKQSRIASTGRGRPRLCYSLDVNAESRWGVTGPYERLTLLLTEIIRSGDSPVEVGRRSGRRMMAHKSENADPVEKLVEALSPHGFDPELKRRGKKVDIAFGTCPFETTALVDPDTVCELHRGIAMGAAESIDGLEIDELVQRDPRRGACSLRCHVEK